MKSFEPPNILYLHSHDTGRYIQPYGYAVPTPNLQHLAEEGMLFRQAFCASPTCSPSRASLLTGMVPHSNGMLGLAHFRFYLDDPTQHMLYTLREAGYQTVLAGEQHIARDPNQIGYDRVLSDDPSVKQRAARIPPQAAHPQPFFLDIGFNETHREYPEPGPQDSPSMSARPRPSPTRPRRGATMAGFITSARRLDQKMGAVLAALEESGLAENTLVICTTDHGLAFSGDEMQPDRPRHRGDADPARARGFRGGRCAMRSVSQTDIFPTLCDLLEIHPPGWLQGRSLLPLARGEAPEIHDAVFSEINFHVAYEPQRAVRTRRWKYIRRFDGRTHPVLPNCDDSPSKSVWMRKRLARPRRCLKNSFTTWSLTRMKGSNLAGHPDVPRSRPNCAPSWTPGWQTPATRSCAARWNGPPASRASTRIRPLLLKFVGRTEWDLAVVFAARQAAPQITTANPMKDLMEAL